MENISYVYKIKLLRFSIQSVKRYIETMAHPLIAVCQMRSIADKVKNLEIVSELAAEARYRSATVCIQIIPIISYIAWQ